MIKKLLRLFRKPKTSYSPVGHPTSCVGEPVDGRDWYKPKQKRSPNDSLPRHVLD